MNRDLVNILRLSVDSLPKCIRNSRLLFLIAQKVFNLPNHLYKFREKYKSGKIKHLESLYMKGNPMELPDPNSTSAINSFHIRLIKKYVLRKAPKTIIDVGCGSGYLISELDKLIIDKDIAGIDIDPPEKSDRKFTKKNNIEFFRGNINDSIKHIKDNCYEMVICTHFLEHIEKPDFLIREMRRISSKTLILVCPLEKPFKWGFNYHVNFFPNTLSFLKLARSDFESSLFFKYHERLGDIMYVEFKK